MEYFKDFFLLFLPDRCFDEYFVKFNFFDGACFTLALSKGLSMGIILGSLLVKVPQITKLVRSRSAAGLSLTSTLMDLLAITISLSYTYRRNFPITTWVETFFLAVQTFVIAVLIQYLNTRDTLKCAALFAAYFGVCTVLITVLPMDALWSLQIANMPLLVCGKLLQAYVCWKRGSTGQISAATVFMLLAGSCARVFTSIAETGDNMLVAIYVVSSSANAVLATQMIYYWNVKDEDDKKKKRKKKAGGDKKDQ